MLGLMLFLAAVPAIDPGRDLIAFWPSPGEAALRLLKEAGIGVVITPPAAAKPAAPAPLRVIAEIPAKPSLETLAVAVRQSREAGYDGAAVSAAGDEHSFRRFLAAQNGFVQIVYLKPEQLAWDVSPALAVLQAGVWPGIRRVSTSIASATQRPWINSNQHLYAYLRAVYPQRAALLSCRPEDASAGYDSVEVALAESFAAGGRVILAFPEAYREALLKAQPRALAAWHSLGRLASFVQKSSALARPDNGARTAIVAGKLDDVEEIINLSYRDNLSPQVLPSVRLPAPPAQQPRILVVAVPVAAEAARQLAAFVSSGGTVVTAPASEQKLKDWWSPGGAKKTSTEPERDVYSLGGGRVYVYHEPIVDPATFALDLVDIAGLDNPRGFGLNGLDFRLWNTYTVLGTLHRIAGGQLVLILTNYGSPHDGDFLVGVRGGFREAAIEEPGADGPRPYPLMPREGRVELNMKGLKRIAVIVLWEK